MGGDAGRQAGASDDAPTAAHGQHRDTGYLLLTNGTAALTGLLFWLLVVRFSRLSTSDVGIGYAIVAIATAIAVVAKGGLDTALLRAVPRAGGRQGRRLFGFAALLGAGAATLLALALAAFSWITGEGVALSPPHWAIAALIAVLLVVTWLQDAHLLAESGARSSFQRNLVLSASRLVLPLPLIALTAADAIPLTWAIALAVSAAIAIRMQLRTARPDGHLVPRRDFVRSALRNVAGGAAEFLPGLLLAPIVFALNGPEPAAYFGMAWTAASVLLLASAAISRSALAAMVRSPDASKDAFVRRAVAEHLLLVLPAALVGILLARPILGIFGEGYASEGALVFAILCASVVFVAPFYLHLAVLRARERPGPLVVFPALLVAALVVLGPLLASRLGIEGVAWAWLLANVPLGVYGAWSLRPRGQGVSAHGRPGPLGGRPHVE